MTLPDGSLLPSGGEFKKVWAIRNSGLERWAAGTRISFVGGTFVSVNGSGGKRSFEVPELEVGESAEIGVEMRAPEKAGKYMLVSLFPCASLDVCKADRG